MLGYSALFPVITAVILGAIALKQVSPSMIDSIKVQKVDTQVIQTEKAIFEAIQRYITLEGAHPASMTDLTSKNYFPSTANINGFGGNYSFTIDANRGTVTISTEIADAYARNSFINSYKNTFKPVQGTGNYVNTTFVLPTSVMHGNGQFMAGIPVQATAPSAAAHRYWYDTSGTVVVLKMSDGSGWKALPNVTSSGVAATSTGTITDSGTLPTVTAEDGDIRYVYDSETNTIQQYIYYNGSWISDDNMIASNQTTPASTQTGSCHQYFVYIPGSSGVEGAEKGWCVAKYEMTPYDISGWGTTSLGAYDVSTSSTKNVTSKPGQKAIGNVTYNNALDICSNKLVDINGSNISGGTPMKYNVYTKLIQDLSSKSNNWTGGAVGNGYMYRGHSDGTDSSTYVIATGADDSDPYINTGNSASSGTDQARILYTSNGDAIWDLAGNGQEILYEGHSSGNSSFYEYTAVNDNHPFNPKLLTGNAWDSSYGVGLTSKGSITSANLLSSPTYPIWYGGGAGQTTRSGIFASYFTTVSLTTKNAKTTVRCIVPAF